MGGRRMDTEKIRQILEIFEQSKVSFMDLEVGDLKIKLEKKELPVSVQEKAFNPVETEKKVNEQTINSPLVGTFYESVKPGEKPFVQIGQRIKKGDVLCIIEAMKSMNEIRANQEGVIQDILIQDGDMVEFDQPLFVIGDSYDS